MSCATPPPGSAAVIDYPTPSEPGRNYRYRNRIRIGVVDYPTRAPSNGQPSVMANDARRAESLQRLPLPYATALQLRDEGMTDEAIAERLELDIDALPTFMRVAEAKLAAASADESSNR
jgi:DNA-directed RNA polymerase specialized sigma24 family protein